MCWHFENCKVLIKASFLWDDTWTKMKTKWGMRWTKSKWLFRVMWNSLVLGMSSLSKSKSFPGKKKKTILPNGRILSLKGSNFTSGVLLHKLQETNQLLITPILICKSFKLSVPTNEAVEYEEIVAVRSSV